MAEDTVFHLQLQCTSRKSTESKTLELSSFPCSNLELKKAIEAKFSIPVCVQSLSYQLAPLTDSDNLVEKRLRSGDSLSVSYLCEGDCKLIRDIIEWIQEILDAVQSTEASSASTLGSVVLRGSETGYRKTSIQLFDWLDPKCYVNKLYFEAEGGLKMLINVYREVANCKWSTMGPVRKYLESFSIQTIGNFGQTFPLRRITLKEGVLDLMLMSLLRNELKQGEPIKTSDEYEGLVWKEVLISAVYAVSNFCELPECQLQVASHPCVLEQILYVAMSEQCPCATSVAVAQLFIFLAHSTATHEFISKPNIVEGLLDVYRMGCEQDKGQLSDKDQRTLTTLKCFTLVLFAQLALASPNLLPSQFITVVLNHMNSFLSKTQPEVIKTYEQEHEYIWATLLPYVKLFYLPNECSKKEAGSYNQQMQELRQTSERVILFFLHSKMSQEYCHEILANEGLVDYVTLMPWHVSSGSRSLAEGVISELSCHMKLQPPRLCSIVQAKLARMHFGLECVVASDSPVELIRSVH